MKKKILKCKVEKKNGLLLIFGSLLRQRIIRRHSLVSDLRYTGT